MKTWKYLGAAAVLFLGTQAASAATLGTIIFEEFVNGTSPAGFDLGGVSATADATVVVNEFNGASTLPGGLPFGYDYHIQRAFLGDDDTSTADAIDDRFMFMLDGSTASDASAVNTLNLIAGVNTGMDNVVFSLFESDAFGNPVGGPLASTSGGGTISAQIQAGVDYLLRVTGNLRADIAATLGIDESTDVGQYKIVGALIPLPPAVLLFLTALGALFGFGHLRRVSKQAA